MAKKVRRFRIILTSILLPAAVLMAHSLPAAEELEALAKSTIQESVAAVACGNRKLIELSGLDYDVCLAKSVSVAADCWGGMQPLIPDLRFGQSDFAEHVNEERVLSTLFILEKCIQASILLSSNGHNGTKHDKSNGPEDTSSWAQDNDSEAKISWADFIQNARSEYANDRNLISKIVDSLKANSVFLVTLDSRGNASAFNMGKDETVTSVSDNLQYWSEILKDTNVRSATSTDDGAILSVGSDMTTDLHNLGVSYMSALEPRFPQCTPDFRRVPCGSCEIDRTDDHRAILTWSSLAIEWKNQKKESMQCWKDGMSELGVNVDTSK
jgi:hypothetical protein